MAVPLQALLIGSVKPLGQRTAPSGIDKKCVERPLFLDARGFSGDAQGDTRHHGGPDKAVHHYAGEHYSMWKIELGEREPLNRPGAFGENLATLGLTEDQVAIGDVFALGKAIVEVSQGRQPCWKLNERFGVPDMAQRVQGTGRTGWYYRVLQPGEVSPRDSLSLLHRNAPERTIRRIWRAFYVHTLDLNELERIAALPKLADSWRKHAARRLQTGRVEDWTHRLTGEERH
nr:MOSC domain-containing protein [uncultured Devosia sp.]